VDLLVGSLYTASESSVQHSTQQAGSSSRLVEDPGIFLT
jgi:hypothetical protein